MTYRTTLAKLSLAFTVLVVGLGAGLSQASTQPVPLIDKAAAGAISTAFTHKKPDNFKQFLTQLSGDKSLAGGTGPAIEQYLAGKPLRAAQQKSIYRLLGIYTRVKYGQLAKEMLTELVAIPTFKVADVPQHENPNIKTMGNALEKIAGRFDLAFRNVDNRVFEVTLPGKSDALIGIHAHADVVPVNKDLWVLDDGTKLDPFTVTTIDGRMYGRGTEDDKNGIVASLLAMKVIKEEQIPLLHTFRLMVDTTEETGAGAIEHYLKHNPTPDYNLALDGSYPVVIAEKGYGVIMANFPVRKGSGKGAEIVSLTGGLATNQIPKAATARIKTSKAKRLKADIDRLAKQYIAAKGKDFSSNTRIDNGDLLLTMVGVSAHSSDPGSGINPVSRLLGLIAVLNRNLEIKENHITDAAQYANDNWGLDFHGKVLGVDFNHAFMGPLTTALTFIGLDEKKLQVAVNLRIPVGKEPAVLQSEIEKKLSQWRTEHNVDMAVDYALSSPMYRNPEGKWVNALLDVASENLGIERRFGSSSGGTSVHDLPNGVQFGLSLPDARYSGHNANEFKTVEQFLLDLQIVTESFARLANLPQLQ